MAMTESGGQGLPEIMENMTSDGATSKTRGVLEGAKEQLFGSEEEESEESGGNDRSDSSRSRQRASTRGRS